MLGNLKDDPVPNIRFNVAKAYTQLLPHLDKSTQSKVQAALEGLQGDKDVDVKYYAQQGLKHL